ncbi:HAD-IIB family hydrolase [Salibacterium aidingense]|uniref:HAD-IIB family hydrolase n=1 Tax=Salibacterium aidingense TaxID=384933 RepID=UPI0004208C99|nr:HAD-IIB family hydrolase [Salibacterium aidingense]
MGYRLLAMSIDGVLLKSNDRMSRETKEAIDFVRNKGVYSVLVTNRSFSAAKKVAKHLKMEHEMICHGGALLAGLSGASILEARMPAELVYDAAACMENYPCRIQLESQDYEWENKQPPTNNMLGKIQFSLGEGLFQPKTYTNQISSAVAEKQLTALRLFGEFEETKDAEDCRLELINEIPGIIIEQQQNHLTIKKEEATKEHALTWLMSELGIQREELIYIGSGTADAPALDLAEIGVAMGQSPEEVKQHADWITRSNDQNGLAYMVKEVFRKQMRVEI